MTPYNSKRWHEWMCAALEGDKNAYRLLLSDLMPWLTAYFKKRVHHNAVEDLVQDTLMTLHGKRQTFDPQYPFGPWIAAVARHRWIDYMRATLKYVETELYDELPSQDNARETCARHDVQILLKCLPPEQAKLVEMVKLQEMSIEDVSQQTGHSPSNVKIMVHRGMKKMKAAVGELQDE